MGGADMHLGEGRVVYGKVTDLSSVTDFTVPSGFVVPADSADSAAFAYAYVEYGADVWSFTASIVM